MKNTVEVFVTYGYSQDGRSQEKSKILFENIMEAWLLVEAIKDSPLIKKVLYRRNGKTYKSDEYNLMIENKC